MTRSYSCVKQDNINKLVIQFYSKKRNPSEKEIRVFADKIGISARSVVERWKYKLNPKLNQEPFTEEEDKLLLQLREKFGHNFAEMAKHFKNRSCVQIKYRSNQLDRKEKRDELRAHKHDRKAVINQGRLPVLPIICFTPGLFQNPNFIEVPTKSQNNFHEPENLNEQQLEEELERELLDYDNSPITTTFPYEGEYELDIDYALE